MEPAASAGPRVYVPIVHPHSPAPTYAVLQFLGFSPPPDPPLPCLLNPNFPPSMTPPCPSPLAVNPPPPPSPKASSPPDSSSYSSSSNRNQKDKKFTSIIKPPPMKKSHAASSSAPPAGALSPSPRRSSVKGSSVPTSISISHTEKDTIIHTNCSNFREVVHQLTGAASGNRDMMPVTMPARAINRNGGVNHGNVKEDIPISPMASTIITPGSTQRVATTSKLLERRKSTKVLQRLSTSCRDLPPLVPSPVTPLASDFEKICLPVTTPTTSQSSSTTATAAAITAASILSSNEAKAMEVGSEEGKSMDKGSSLSHAMDMGCDSHHAMEMGSFSTHGMGMCTDSSHAEELAIARKGFFLHSQRPKHGDPTLLHLFPESPREQ